MENFGIQTTQNVFIINRTASIGERMLATIIDIIIIISYIYLINIIALLIDKYDDRSVFQMIFMIPLCFYSLASEIFMNGQSFGKKVMKIKVAKIDGSQISIGNYITRWIFRPIDVYMLYGVVAIITIAINGKGQRLGDIISKTTVISLKKKGSLDKTIYVDVDDDYKPFYEDISMLEETDIITVKDVLAHYKNNIASIDSGELLTKTAQAIARKTNINIEENPKKFLEQIMSDYNFIHKK